MIQHYSGPLGNFQYDDTEFQLKINRLRYIGTETDGSKIKIPEGITDCRSMFFDCSALVKAPEIPTGVTDCGYMFYDCSSLVEVPEIPAGVTDCDSMFWGCSSLVKAPVIPAGVTNCSSMFHGCSSLTKAPEIPAGVTNCGYMFYGCRSLVRAPEIPAGADCKSMFFCCNSLQNYSLVVTQRTQRAYYNCSLVIQEIDDFIQNFTERNQLNDKTV